MKYLHFSNITKSNPMKKYFIFLIICFLAPQLFAKNEYIIHRTYYTPPGLVIDGGLTGDMKYVIAVDKGNAIRSWRYQSGRALKAIRTGTHKATTIVVHPTKPWVFSGGKDKNINIWDIKKGTQVKSLPGHEGPIKTLAISNNGELLLSGGNDAFIRLWQLEQNKVIGQIMESSRNVIDLAFHPSNKIMAWVNGQGEVKIWDISKKIVISSHRKHTKPVNEIAFSSKGSIIASASNDKTIILWDWKAKQLLTTFSGHNKPVTGLSFHPQNENLISCSADGTIILWDVRTRKRIDSLNLVDKPVKGCRFSIDGKKVLGIFQKNYVKTWSLGDKGFFASLKGHTNSVQSIDISKNGSTLISASQDNTIKIWNIKKNNHKLIKTFKLKNYRVEQIRFAPDNIHFATAGSNAEIRIWDRRKKKDDENLFISLRGHRGKINSIDYHPSQNLLISAGADKFIMIWNLDQKKFIYKHMAHKGQINTIRFSKTGDKYATGSMDRTAKIWSLKSNRQLFTLKRHQRGIRNVAFSPDGKTLASASDDKKIILWDVQTGKALKTLRGHDFIVSTADFSVDSKTLISSSRDKTVRLWDVSTGNFLKTLTGERDQITSVSINHPARLLAVSTLGTEINLLRLPKKYFASTTSSKKFFSEFSDNTSIAEEDVFSSGTDLESQGQTDPNQVSDQDIQTEIKVEEKDKIFEPVIEELDHELLSLQTELNRLLKIGNTCEDKDQIETISHRILNKMPDDQSAYFGIMKARIAEKDLPMVYVMSKFGYNAVYQKNQYDFSSTQQMNDFFGLWRDTVFSQMTMNDPSNMQLEFNDCNDQVQMIKLPQNLLFIDIPTEIIEKVFKQKIYIDFGIFSDLQDNATAFRDRLLALIDAIEETGVNDKVFKLDIVRKFIGGPGSGVYGYLTVNLTNVQQFGMSSNRALFQVKQEKPANAKLKTTYGWRSYLTDQHRIKTILLRKGNYYLKLNNKVRKAFMIIDNNQKINVVLN
jgi:WD40 repeat protein